VDRVFLDANILFSASYREDSGLLHLWQLKETELVTSHYALAEAQRNVVNDSQLERLNGLAVNLLAPLWIQDRLPEGVSIATKDLPILLDAINSQATHLLTGGKQHFGSLYGQVIGGVLVLSPAEYLASRRAMDPGAPRDLPS
jgi:predicted nucleic acid-binding protein